MFSRYGREMKAQGPKQGKIMKGRGEKGVGKRMMRNTHKEKRYRWKRNQEKNSKYPKYTKLKTMLQQFGVNYF